MKKREFADLTERLCEIGDPSLMARLLEEILTPAELEAVVSRWTICRLLLEGLSQRDIARKLGVSLCKITRGARELKREDSVIRSLLVEGTAENAVEVSPSPCPRPRRARTPQPKSKKRTQRP